MRNHAVWWLVAALSVFGSGSKVPRQIVYSIRPAPLTAFTSSDGTFLLNDGVTQFQFPTFGLKTAESGLAQPTPAPIVAATSSNIKESTDESSSSSSSSSSSAESSSASANEEIVEIPVPQSFAAPQVQQVNQKLLKLEPEQIQQIFHFPAYQPLSHVNPDLTVVNIGPQYQYRPLEFNSGPPVTPAIQKNPEDIKTSQTEVITQDKLQSANSERKEKRRRVKEPPGDASYAFGYETDESARHEVADPNGNVKGWYTYVDADGTVRKIIYTAGAGKGFVILGKEKVRSPGLASPVPRKSSKSNKAPNTEYLGFAADTAATNALNYQKAVVNTPPTSFANYYTNLNDLTRAGTSNPPLPPPRVGVSGDTLARTKKPVFIVKIRRPVKKKYETTPIFAESNPIPVPATTTLKLKRPQRRQIGSLTLADVVPSLRKSRIKKYPTPPIYYADEANDSSDESSSSQQTSSSSSASTSTSQEYDIGVQNRGASSTINTKSETDSSYVFGYETDTSNRLEKADGYGNVRGSYSYIDPESGVKRTVHYIAGADTGFQVIHASPSISRGVRLEAPAGYIVKRVPALRTSESRFPPIPISVPRPSAIVYHIHPDSSWKPWEPTTVRKKVKIHRKKLPKELFENAQKDGIVLLQTHPDPTVSSSSNNGAGNNEATSIGTVNIIPSASAATNPYFREKVTAAGSGAVTQKETQFPSPSPTPGRRRHAPQRGYTADHHFVQVDDDSSERPVPQTYLHPSAGLNFSLKPAKLVSPPSNDPSSGEQIRPQTTHEREPLLYSPTFETVRESASSIGSPVPIQLQPTQVAVKNRGAPTLYASPSNNHPLAFTSDGKLHAEVPTFIVETIETKSSSSSSSSSSSTSTLGTKSSNNNQNDNKNIAHQLPEPAALKQQQQTTTSPLTVAIANKNNINVVKGLSVTASPLNEFAVASAANYQKQFSSATVTPTPPSASPSSASRPTNNNNQPKSQSSAEIPIGSTAAISGNINQLPVSSPSSTQAPRNRRKHHRTKTTSYPSVTPTSPSAFTASISSNINSLNDLHFSSSSNIPPNAYVQTVSIAGAAEATASSSKGLINRLAAITGHDATIVAA